MRSTAGLFSALLLMFSLQAEAGKVVALGAQDALKASAAAQAFMQTLLDETAVQEKRVVELQQQAEELQVRLQSKELSKDEGQRLQLQLQKVATEFQRQGSALQQERAQREQAFIDEMRPKLDAVLRELIEEQDISVILNRQATIYMEAGVDITAEVVKRLDAL
ncbi:MAG: OmpH family outer membrane protein [Oceanospirillaceae bacterium]|nr:OmpH family outer membrane protein [Oceanospirillaceae bacterium]